MGYLRIKCHECGGYWEAYSYNIKDDHLRMCPHCCKEIDRQTWNTHIIPAFSRMEEATMELQRDHDEYPGVALFTLQYRTGKQCKGITFALDGGSAPCPGDR